MPAEILQLTRQLESSRAALQTQCDQLRDQRRLYTERAETDSRFDFDQPGAKVKKDAAEWATRWRQTLEEAESDKEFRDAITEAYDELCDLDERVVSSFRLKLVQQLEIAGQRDAEGFTPWGEQPILLQLLRDAMPDASLAVEEDDFLDAVVKALERSKLEDADVEKLIDRYGTVLAEYMARYLDFSLRAA